MHLHNLELHKATFPVWYLMLLVFLVTSILWGFVFAWHTTYSQRPVFTLKLEFKPWLAATFAGLCGACIWSFALDPLLQLKIPQEYPTDPRHWFAMTLSTLSLGLLFLIFAPYAWLIRLFRNQWVAISFTVLLGVVVLIMKTKAAPVPVSVSLFTALILLRIVSVTCSLLLYLRGGLLLTMWFVLLIEARHLFKLG